MMGCDLLAGVLGRFYINKYITYLQETYLHNSCKLTLIEASASPQHPCLSQICHVTCCCNTDYNQQAMRQQAMWDKQAVS